MHMTAIKPDQPDYCRDASLEALLAAALTGDNSAYRTFLHQSLPYLRSCARRMVSVDMQDDLVQETLIAVDKVHHTFDVNYPVRPWLAGIMRMKAREAWRKQRPHGSHVSLDDLDHEALTSNEEEHSGAVIDLASLTARFNPETSRALIATRLHGQSIEETAIELGKSTSWVKVTVHRAIKLLRNELMEALK